LTSFGEGRDRDRDRVVRRETDMTRDLFYGASEQAKAGKHRLDDARALLNSVRWRGAMYLAGYSVECLLKTKLMRRFDCRHLRELEEELQRRGVISAHATIFTRQLELLLRLAQGLDRLRQNEPMWRLFNLLSAHPGLIFSEFPLALARGSHRPGILLHAADPLADPPSSAIAPLLA
jgi:hypothetical protein